MSDQIPGGKTDEASGDDGKENTSKTVSYESHAKLLAEKKKASADRDAFQARIEAMEQEQAEKAGDLKKQNDILKQNLKAEKDRVKGLTKTVSTKVVRSQFSAIAKELGCVDADLAFKACDIGDLDLDENFEFDSNLLKSKLEGLAKEKPYMFKKDANPPRDKVPANIGPGDKDISSMTLEEQYKALAKL